MPRAQPGHGVDRLVLGGREKNELGHWLDAGAAAGGAVHTWKCALLVSGADVGLQAGVSEGRVEAEAAGRALVAGRWLQFSPWLRARALAACCRGCARLCPPLGWTCVPLVPEGRQNLSAKPPLCPPPADSGHPAPPITMAAASLAAWNQHGPGATGHGPPWKSKLRLEPRAPAPPISEVPVLGRTHRLPDLPPVLSLSASLSCPPPLSHRPRPWLSLQRVFEKVALTVTRLLDLL